MTWFQDEPWFYKSRWEHYGTDDLTRASTTLPDGRRLMLHYVRDFGPVCGARYATGMICSLSPGHECPCLASAEHITRDLGQRTEIAFAAAPR